MARDDEAYDVNQEVDPQEPVKYVQYTALRDYFKRELQAGLNQLQENQEQFAANIATNLQNIGLDTQQLREDIAALATLIQPRDDASVHNDGGNDDSGRQVRQPHGGAPRGRGRGNGHGRGGAAFGARRDADLNLQHDNNNRERNQGEDGFGKLKISMPKFSGDSRTNPSQEGEDDQDLTSSSHSSTKVADPSVQSENTSIAYKGITSLEDKERVAGSNLCLTAHVHDDGIMREEREAAIELSEVASTGND
ncbi:hypothetical protein EJB05_22450, partial [Eragrostis curvula]